MAQVSVSLAVQYLKDMGVITKNYNYEDSRITDEGSVIIIATGKITGAVKKNIEIRYDDKVFDRTNLSSGGVVAGNGTELYLSTPFSTYAKDFESTI